MSDLKLLLEVDEKVALETQAEQELMEALVKVHIARMYCDLGYPSLYKYLVFHHNYSEAEAIVRRDAVKLFIRSDIAKSYYLNGLINLTQSSILWRVIRLKERSGGELGQSIEDLLLLIKGRSTRETDVIVHQALDLPFTKKTSIVLSDEKLIYFNGFIWRKLYALWGFDDEPVP